MFSEPPQASGQTLPPHCNKSDLWVMMSCSPYTTTHDRWCNHTYAILSHVQIFLVFLFSKNLYNQHFKIELFGNQLISVQVFYCYPTPVILHALMISKTKIFLLLLLVSGGRENIFHTPVIFLYIVNRLDWVCFSVVVRPKVSCMAGVMWRHGMK